MASMVDGVQFGERRCVVALGVDIDGVKHPAFLVTELLVGCAPRSGCQPSDRDRARRVQALRRAARDVFDHPVIARSPATQTEECPTPAASEAAFGGGQADARGLSRPDRAGRLNEAGKQSRRSTATYIYGCREAKYITHLIHHSPKPSSMRSLHSSHVSSDIRAPTEVVDTRGWPRCDHPPGCHLQPFAWTEDAAAVLAGSTDHPRLKTADLTQH